MHIPFFRHLKQEHEKKDYIRICLEQEGIRKTRMSEKTTYLANLWQRFEQTVVALINRTRHKDDAELELDGLTNLISQRGSKAATEFDELLEVIEVHRVEFEPDIIRVITHPITLESGGLVYKLGRFAIKIVKNESIMVRNLENTGVDQSYDHPQIKKGKLNLPVRLRVPLTKLIIGLEYADVVQLIVNILKNYDENLSYIKLEDNWKGVRP